MLALDRTKNDTSLTLDALRALAAQMVLVGHSLSFFENNWRPERWPYMQNEGVLIFFLLSGFLITATIVGRTSDPAYGFKDYFIDRFARIYSGLVPALILIAIVDGITLHFTAEPSIARNYTPATFGMNLLMMQAYRGYGANFDALQWPMFGSASPLWTLAIEWHIYLFVAAVFFIGARTRWVPLLIVVAVAFGQEPSNYVFGALGPDGVGSGLFSLWLMGSAVYFIARAWPPNYLIAVPLLIASLYFYGKNVQAGVEYTIAQYPLLALALLGLIWMTQLSRVVTSERLAQFIRFMADYSFSLYLIHHTLIAALLYLWPGRPAGHFYVAILLSNAVAIALAQIGEKHHRKLAAMLKGIRIGRSPSVPATDSVPVTSPCRNR